MKILVTGSSGFIGTNLVQYLLEYGNEVVGIDIKMPKKNYEHDDNFDFIHCDIQDAEKLKSINDHFSNNFDIVFNLACPASPPKYQANPLNTIHTNLAVENICYIFSNSQIIHASTSEVYGDPQVSVQCENYLGNVNNLGPRACYDEGKRMAETILYEFWNERRLKYPPVIARIFNTYGPWMDSDDGRVVSNFINQALNNKNITIYGTGQQTRSFCYIDDLIDAFDLIMQKPFNDLVVMNLGNHETYSMKELAEKILENIDSDSEIVYEDLPIDDPKQRIPNTSRAERLLDWSPSVSLNTGLKETIEYFVMLDRE